MNSEFLVTADEGIRGGKKNSIKETADKALQACPNVKNAWLSIEQMQK